MLVAGPAGTGKTRCRTSGTPCCSPETPSSGPGDQWLEQPDGEKILANLDFYKVSRHGSENATPKSALEHMVTAGYDGHGLHPGEAPWPSIPDTKLMGALAARTTNRVVRSDSRLLAGVPTVPGIADPSPRRRHR